MEPEEETAPAERRAAEREEFFQKLEDDVFPDEEAALKESVWDALEMKGGTCRLNQIAADDRVKRTKAALLPKGVSISLFIQRRMSDILAVEPDPVARDNQIVSFADESLIQPEARERVQTASTKGKGKARPTDHSRAFMTGKGDKYHSGAVIPGKGDKYHSGAFMPGKGSYSSGTFMTGKGVYSPPAHFGYASAIVNGKGKRGYEEVSGYSKGKGKRVKGEEMSSIKGSKGKYVYVPDVHSSKGKGKFSKDYENGASEEMTGAQQRQRAADAFFESLPQHELTAEETVLLNAMLDKISSAGGSARLNLVVHDPDVNQAKRAVLPRDVRITQWIEGRIASSVAIEADPTAPDNQIVSIVQNGHARNKRTWRGAFQQRPPPHVTDDDPGLPAAAKKAADRDAFIQGLPPDGFTDEENAFLDALISKLQDMGGSGRLNDVSADPGVKQTKMAFLPKCCGVAHWIENRVGMDFTIEPDPVAKNNQIISIAGSLRDEPQAKRMKL